MKTIRRFHTRLGGLMFALVASMQIAQPLLGASATWTGATDNQWGTGTNWSATPLPGLGDTATFNAAAGVGGAIINTGSISLGTLAFDTGSAAAYTIGGATVGTGQITFGDGTTNIITMSNTVAQNQLVNANILLGTAIASNSTISNASTTNTLTIAGNITGGTGGTAAAKTLTLAGAGAINLTGTVTKGGGSTLVLQNNNTGTVTLSNANSLYTQLLFGGGGSTSVIDIGSGTLRVNNAGAATIQTQGTTSATINATGGGTLALQVADGDWGAANGTTLTINAPITGAFRFENFVVTNGTGVTVLANNNNSFSGGIQVNSSVVQTSTFGTVGLNSGLGSGNTLTLGAGTLRYTGAGEQSNKIIALPGTTATAALDASGTGTLHLTNTAAIATGAGIKTWTLTGTASGRIDAIIADNTATNKTSLAKTGTGTWVLGGVNTYTGTTSVTGGNLVFTNAQTLPGAVTWNNAGISYAASTDAALNLGGAVTLTNGANLAFGGSIGATTTSARVIVGAVSTAPSAGLPVDIYGISGTTPATGTYTLLSATTGLGTNAPTLRRVYNNTNFTVGTLTTTATALTAGITAATPITTAFWKGGLSGATNVWAASNGTTASNWTTTAGGAVQVLVPGAGADVTITATAPVTAPTATVLGANMSIKSLTIADTTNGLGLNGDGNTLTIATASGITMNASVPASSVNSSIALGASQTWTNNSANLLTANGIISGAFGITKAGTGPLTLGGLSTFTGGVTVTGASKLNINSPTALGTGTLALNVAGITIDNTLGQPIAMTANNPITFAAAATSLTFAGANANSNLNLGTGAVTFGTATTITTTNAASSLTAGGTVALGTFAHIKAGAGTLALSGVVGGTKTVATTALTINGGTLAISNNANTFNGNIAVSGAGSVFQVAAGASYTTASPFGTVAGGTSRKSLFLTNGGTFRLLSGTLNNDNVTTTNIGGGIIFNFGTGGGVLDVATGATLIIDDGTTVDNSVGSAQIQGTGSITKIGGGILQIDDSTAYVGQIIVNGGLLQPASANAFGTAAGNTTINSGAALNVNGITMTNAEPLTINGTGLTGTPVGALANTSATAATWVGPITLGSAATIGSSAAGGLTLSSGATVNTVGNALTFSISGTGRIFTDGVISGAGAVIVSGSSTGDYVPRGAHTYTGGTTLNAGSFTAVDFTSTGPAGNPTAGPFGSGTTPLVLNGGQMRSGTGGSRTIGNTVTISADTTFYTAASEKTLIFSGPVTLSGGNRTLTSNVGSTVAGTSTTFNGAIGEDVPGRSLTKAGVGNLILGGANTYTGITSATNGTLLVTGSLANNSGLSISPSAASGAVINFINNAANTPANFNSLALGSATGTSFLGLDLGTSSDTIATLAAATATNNIGFHLNPGSGFGAGTYNLISAASGLTAGGATYSLGTVPGGYTYAFTNTDSLVQLTTTAATAGGRYWRGNLGSSWATFSGVSTTNWATDAAGTIVSASTPGAGDTVFFSATGATGPTITTTVDNNFTINDLQFLSSPTGITGVTINPGFNVGTLSPGTLTLVPSLASTGLTLAQGSGAVTIAAPITLGAPQTWSLDSSTPGSGTASSLTVSGAISGVAANALTFTTTAGTTPIVLSAPAGTSTYSGPSTISAATIVQGGATNTFSPNTAWTVNGTLNTGAFSQATGSLVGGSGIVQNGSATNATLTFGSDNLTSATFAGTIQNGLTGTLGITKAGTGLQILNSTNTYTGTTTVSAGTLRLGSAVVAVPVAVSGGTLQVGGNLPSNTTITLSGTGTFDLFGASQTVASLTSVAGNTIANSSSSTAASTATTLGTPSGSGVYVDSLTISGAGPTMPLLITDGATRKTQIITNNVNSGTGFMGFTNGALNTFSGGLVLANNATGTRFVINAAITGTPFGSGPIIIGQTATDKAGIFFSTASNTVGLPIVFNTGLGSDRFGIRNDGQTITLSGLITANSDAVFSSNSATASNTIITNKITGAGGLVIDLSQTNTANTLHTITLNTAANTNDYAGDTIIGRTNTVPGQNYAATLVLGASEQIPNGSGKGNITLNSDTASRTGTLNLAGFSETINGLSGNGIIEGATAGTPTNTLTVGDNNATATFSGIIRNTAGSLTLTKIGTGTQTLSGANTFTGSVNSNGGLIAFPTSPATTGPLGSSTVVNLNGGGISYTGTTANALNRPIAIGAASGTVNVVDPLGNLTISSVTSSGGNLVKTGNGTATLEGTTTLGGGAGVVVNDGILVAGFGTSGVSTITIGATGNLNMNNATIETLTLGNTLGALTLAGGSRLGFELTSGITNDSIAVGATGTASTTGTITFDFFGSVGAGTYNLLSSTLGGLIGGSYVLGTAPNGFNYTINQTDTLISLTTVAYSPTYWNNTQGDNSWANVTGNLGSIGGGAGTNFTTLQTGLVDIGHAPTATETVIFNTDTIVGPSITTTLDGTRTIDSLQFIGAGSPAVTSVTIDQGTGSGILTLKPASASGGISILAGGGSATINAPLTLDNTLSASQTWNIVDATSTLNIAGDITFGANITKSGLGAVTLSGNNSGMGNIALTSGTLNINSNTALGTSGTLTIGPGTTIDSTVGGVSISNTNPETWNGSFTFTGTNSLNLGAGAVTLTANTTVTTVANVLTIGGVIGETGGSRALTKAGAGTLFLDASNTYTGLTTISGGSLRITKDSGLGTTASGTIQSGTSALELDGTGGDITVGAEALTINGGGISNFGALRNIAGNNIYGGTVTLAAQSRINSDSGTLTLSNPTAVTGATQTLVVGGAGNTTISGAISTTSGGLIKDGAGILTLSGTNTYTGSTAVNAGTLIVSGTSSLGIPGAVQTLIGTTAGSTGTLVIKSTSATALNMGTGSGSLYVGQNATATSEGVLYLAPGMGGTGAITQSSTGSDINIGWANGATGNATGTIYQSAGTFTQNATGRAFYLGLVTTAGGTGSGTYNIDGGTLNTNAKFYLSGTNGANLATGTVSGLLNVSGTGVVTSTNTIFQPLQVSTSGLTKSATINLNSFGGNSGVLQTPAWTAAGAGNGTLNFNGGTLKFGATGSATFLSATTSAVNIYANGAIIDTNGNSNTITQVLQNPADDAVTSVAFTGTSNTYLTPPTVTFSGGNGTNATGYATLDASGQINGIVVTNGGSFTGSPTATISGQAGTFTVNTAANTSGGLIKTSTGTLTLSGTNTFSGPVDIRGGILSVATLANGGSPSGLGQSSSAAANVLLNGGILSYIGTVAGTTDRDFTLTTNGGGFDASGTTLGTLTIGGNIVVSSTSGSQTLTLQGTGTGATGGGTLNSVIANGTGSNITSLAKIGTGSWTLGGSGANTYTGLTTVTGSGGTGGALTLAKTGGALAIPGNLTVGSGTATTAHVLFGGNEQISNTATVTLNGVNSGWAYLQLQGKTQTFGNIVETTPGYGVIETKEGAGTFGTSNAIFNVASGTQTYQGYFRDINTGLDATNSLKLTKTGAGTLQWGAATGAGAAGTSTTAHNYSGGTDIQNGTLQLLAPNTAGNSISIVGAGNVSLNGGATFAGTLDLNGLNAGITGLDGTTGTVLGQIVNNVSSTTAILTIGNNGNAGNFAGLINDNTTGTGIVGINKLGAGIQVLSGANTYTGNTTLTAGTLNLGGAETPGTSGPLGDQLANAAGTIILNGGTLQYSSANQFDYSGRFTTTASQQYRVDTNGQNVTWATNLVSTGGLLVKSGTGTLTLSGSANTYTGTTTVSAGELLVSGSTNTGSAVLTVGGGSTGALTIATGGSFTTTGALNLGAGIIGNALNVQSGATLSVGSISNPWGSSYTVDGTLTSAGVWTVSTNRTTDTFNGTGTISATALTLGNASTGVNYTGSGTINLTGGVTVASNNGAGVAFYTQTSGTLNASSILLGDSTTNTAGSRTFNLNGGRVNLGSGGIAATGTTTATKVVNLGAGTLGASANWSSSLAMALTSATPGVTINTLDSVDNTTARTITLSGILSGSGALNKSGVGTLVLSGTNTYNGPTSVSGGTLQAGAAAGGLAFGTLSAVTLANAAGALLDLNNFNQTIGSLAGGGATGGNVTLGSGTLTAGGNNTTTSFDGTISGTGGLTKVGTGTLTLSGLSATASNNYSGTTIIDRGTLAIITTSPTLTGGLTFGATAGNTTAGTLDLSGIASTATWNGALLVPNNASNVITIGVGKTLNTNGNVTIGQVGVPSVAATPVLTIGGGGNWSVTTAAGGVMQIGASNGTGTGNLGENATLDLTGLATAAINVSNTGSIRVSNPQAGNTSGVQSALLLPIPVVSNTTPVTTIISANLNVGDGAAFNSSATQINKIMLGTGLTTLNVNTVNVGTGNRDIGQITFANANGNLLLRAADGTSRAALNIGTGGATTGTTGANNLVDLAGHSADLLISTLNVGNQARVGNLTSTFNFDTGTLDATSVNIGFRTGTASTTSTLNSIVAISGGTVTLGNSSGTGTGVDIGNSTYNAAGIANTSGTLNISNGTVTINNSTSLGAAVRLGTNSATGGGLVSATMNLTGGSTTVLGNIIKNVTLNTGVTSSLTLDGATAMLDMSLNSIGTAGQTITLNAKQGTLQNLSELNGGGNLTKTTAGTLILSGTNAYTGKTIVQDGTVSFSSGNVSATADQHLGKNADLDLGLASTSSGWLLYTGSIGTLAKNINVLGNGTDTIENNGGDILTLSGTINANGTTVTLKNTNANSQINVSGTITGVSANSNVVIDGGTTTLSGANSYTGSTNLTGGTLLLGTDNVLPNGAAFTLSGGTKLGTGGNDANTGALTLGGSAIIDMGNASSILSFTDISAWTGLLSVWNWTGTARTAGGTDQLIFTGSTTPINLANVNFYSDGGSTLLGGGGAVFDGTELVPVPEPGAVLAGLMLLGMIGYRERRRRTNRVA